MASMAGAAGATTAESTTITARELIDVSPLGSRRRAFILVGFLCVLLDGIDIGAWGFVYPRVVAEWGVTVGQVTAVATIGYIMLALGALVAGPLADRFGRRPILLASMALFGGPMIIAGFAGNIETVGVCRAIACTGLGAVMPTVITSVSEYLPLIRRALLLTLMFCGFPLGQSVVGYMAALIVPTFGWSWLLIVGGIAAVALIPVIATVLPESLNVLLRRPAHAHRAEQVVAGIAKSVRETRPVVTESTDTAADSYHQARGVRMVLSRKLILTSLIVWFAYLVNCTVTYVIIGYLPLIMAQAGTGTAGSGLVVAMAGWGGVIGSLLIGYMMGRFGNYRSLVIGLTLTAISVSAVAFGDWQLSGLLVLGLVWGILNAGSNGGMNAFSAQVFPPNARATGVSWMHSAGKLGAIFSGLLGGLMITAGWGIGAIFISFAIPLLMAAAGFGWLAFKNQPRTKH
jgi:AAHS family 4-hydroxybenzoate transporter-like MFS transporter